MEKSEIKEYKKKLEKEKKRLTKELSSFAKRDKKVKGNWLARFPLLGNDRSHKDENAEEVETYESLLSLEHILEQRLKYINQALAKIEKGGYGACEVCQRQIEPKRLAVAPEARHCIRCSGKNY